MRTVYKDGNIKMNNRYYLPNPTIYHIHQLGFHYSIDAENYILLFPIFKYKGKPTLFCKLVYNIIDNILTYDIINSSKNLLALYYDREFGNAKDYIKKIDSIVKRRIRAMGFKKKKKQINHIRKGEKMFELLKFANENNVNVDIKVMDGTYRPPVGEVVNVVTFTDANDSSRIKQVTILKTDSDSIINNKFVSAISAIGC